MSSSSADSASSQRLLDSAGSSAAVQRRPALEPCVTGATIAQERKWLEYIRQLALDVDDKTMLTPDLRAVEFAFLYVREDRTKRQANIRRCKEQSKQRRRDAAAAGGTSGPASAAGAVATTLKH